MSKKVLSTSAWWLAFVLCVCLSQGAHAVGVAVINDGDVRGDFDRVLNTFVGELETLTRGEFDLQIKSLSGGWTAEGITRALETAYADPTVDMVLVLGLASNQLLVSYPKFEKPTFMPIVFDRQLVGAPLKGNKSGQHNLNYLTDPINFDEDVRSLQRVFPFRHAALFLDEILTEIVEHGPMVSPELAEMGVTLTLVPHTGKDHDMVSGLPGDIDAVIVAGLPRMPAPEFDRMINALTERKLPSFSLVGGQPSVARGFLASDAVSQDWTRLARRNALNMQSVLLGQQPEDLPVLFKGKRELSINLETARRIGFSPRFDILSEAVLFNEEAAAEGPTYDLRSVAELAVARNLDLLAQKIFTQAASQNVNLARSSIFPRAELGAGFSQRKVSPLVESGQFAQRSLDGTVTLSQAIYADSIWANFAIQKYLNLSREHALEQVRLDIIQAAAIAFLNVLRAETQLTVQQNNLKVTRANLDLARDRVQVGTATAADIYRWETRMASVRSELLAARAGLEQAREALNRLVHRPLTERFQLEAPEYSAPFVLTAEEFDRLVDNPASWRALVSFYVEQGLERSFELAEIRSLIQAKQREVSNVKRSYWLPDFSLQARYSDNFSQSGVGAGPFENLDDWNVMVVGSIPIFDGGNRRAALSRADLELEQLKVLLASTREKVEQDIRASLHRANASFVDIELAQQAEAASRKSLELVTASYASGVETVVDLLDAQNSALAAEEAAVNSVYDFLIDVMDGQRALGRFEFLLPPDLRSVAAQQLKSRLAEQER